MSLAPSPDSRILVTGGAGFIGSAIVWELNRRGCERIVVSDLLGTSEKWRNLTPLRFEDYLEADDLRPRLESGALGKFDYVFHLGACSATTERDATYLIRNNYEFTKDLAVWSLAAGARFVYASSAATYGDGSAGMSDTEPRLDRFRPLNMYGYSKHLFDLYAARQGWLDRIVGLKYFNVFGPNEGHKEDMRSLVHKSYSQALETGVIRLFKSYKPEYRAGEQQRDFLYVKDAVAMTLHLAARPSAHGLFNIGSGEAHTWIELATAVFRALDREPKIEFIEMPEVLRGKYQYFTQADIGKLRAAGYADAVTPLVDAVADYIRGYVIPGRALGDEA
jgi:ADP-L-glycero-D-manno-heptose 6-epimerase